MNVYLLEHYPYRQQGWERPNFFLVRLGNISGQKGCFEIEVC